MKTPYNIIFNFIRHTCHKFSIDDSHGLKHSMDVFKYSQRILKNEIVQKPFLQDQERVIYTSANSSFFAGVHPFDCNSSVKSGNLLL